jgi:hypothetical protein
VVALLLLLSVLSAVLLAWVWHLSITYTMVILVAAGHSSPRSRKHGGK